MLKFFCDINQMWVRGVMVSDVGYESGDTGSNPSIDHTYR